MHELLAPPTDRLNMDRPLNFQKSLWQRWQSTPLARGLHIDTPGAWDNALILYGAPQHLAAVLPVLPVQMYGVDMQDDPSATKYANIHPPPWRAS